MISIHALRKESDGYVQEVADHLDISIHALRKESDLPPERRNSNDLSISIHALRKESDFFLFWRLRPFINFNPRSP